MRKDIDSQASKVDQFHVVGIGFSAGGLDSLKTFFDHTPQDGVAYVIIQHLPADFKSRLGEILLRHSKLEIFDVEDNLPIEPNHVYMLPERKNVTIQNGKLHLSESDPKQPNTVIDIFLDSLASSFGSRSIGVILSGAGSDGTRGVGSIKKAGGMVIVQSPDSSPYSSMPDNVIESGYADLILTPEEMPSEIMSYFRQIPLVARFLKTSNEQDESIIISILALIYNATPLDFSEYKRPTIIRRILRRMSQLNMDTLSGYHEFLTENPEEVEILSKEFLISVTRFFRDQEAFDVLKEKVIPEIVLNKLIVDNLKVWVIGCATGEEAYSMAILIKEYLTEIKKDLEVKIFATDIDSEAIKIAARGVYSHLISHDVSPTRIENFFQVEGDKYKIRDNIRKMVIFAQHDIIKQPPYGKIDLISCRNLLIYLNPILQKKVFSTMHFCLNLGGYLFLGSSESLGDFKRFFKEKHKKFKIYKNIEPARTIAGGNFITSGVDIKKLPSIRSDSKKSSFIGQNSSSEIIIRSLLRYSDYSGAFIDANHNIIQPLGDLKKYFKSDIQNFNLLEVLPEELSIAIGGSLFEVFANEKEITIKDVTFADKNSKRTVTVHIIPSSPEKGEGSNAVVLFRDTNAEDIIGNSVEVFNKAENSTKYISILEKELKELKEKIEDAYNILEIANDTQQAYSEELVSGNEEMQSTNEELQSINEELQTVNNEYQSKIRELAELNDDLTNYFRSAANAQLYVDRDLIIRKFTDDTTKQINLIESDLGRSLTNISTNIKFEGFIEDIIKVISDSVIFEKEVETKENRWYLMTIVPYIKRQDNKTDGAIITFNEITELKRAQQILLDINAQALVEKNIELTKTNNDLDTFIYAASHDLKAPISNIEGLLITMAEDLSDEDNKEITTYINMMNLSVERLKKVVLELTEINKIQKSIHNDIHEINLSELYMEIVHSVNDLILKVNPEINLNFELCPTIHFSRKNLRSILYNLVSNAIKYNSPDRTCQVSIESKFEHGYSILTVKDNGLGIASYNANKVFEMYRRFHDHVDGSGIGLYMVKRIMDNAGGKIELETELGKGSTFKVYFKQEA